MFKVIDLTLIVTLKLIKINDLSEYSLQKQNENLLKNWEEAFPTNNVVQESLQTLISRKATWVERLKATWNERITPTLDEFEVRELCIQFAQESQQNRALIQVSGGQQLFLPNPSTVSE